MKMQDRIFFKKFVISGTKTISSMVEEIAPKKIITHTQKIFSAADLWNIQRRRQGLLVR
ncbi:MAG: hypothetical protein QM737_01275 [Ferruginibacter sp.]